MNAHEMPHLSQAESAYYVANMSVEVHKLIKLG